MRYLSLKTSPALQYWRLAPKLSTLKLWLMLGHFLFEKSFLPDEIHIDFSHNAHTFQHQLRLSEVFKHCAEWVRDSQKGTGCELASVTLQYNSWLTKTPLTLTLIHHMGWIIVLTGFGVMHTPPHSRKHWCRQAYDRVKTPVDPYFTTLLLSHSERQLSPTQTAGSCVHAKCTPVLICLCDKSQTINRAVKWTCLLDRGDAKRGRTANIFKQKGNQCCSLLVFSLTLLSLFIFYQQST